MRIKRWSPLALGASAAALTVLLGGCSFDTVQSALDPQATVAREQMWLLTYTFWLSFIVVVGVGAALVYAIVRFRHKEGDDSIPPQTHGNALLEMGLIGLAVLITIAVAIPTVRTNFRVGVRAQATEDDIVINVTGYQWWWAFDYADEGVLTANEMHVPQGSRVILNLASADVLHSFWVPKLGGKTDLIPNQDNQLWYLIDEDTPAGVYYGECAELCLGAHAYMRMRVVVDTPEDYQAWLASFQDIAPLEQLSDTPTFQQVQADPLVQTGQQLFKQKGCAACHAIRGYAGGAPDKPDLTNFGLRTSLAAGVLDNTPENLARWLRDPQEVKPGNYMPTLWSEDDPQREEQIAALVAYLESLGTQDAPQAQLEPGGNYGN